jgi:hypothetical protein
MFEIIPKKGKKLFLLAVLLLGSGCITLPPIQHEIKTESVYPVRHEEVWELVNESVKRNIAAVEKADKKSGLIRTKKFKVPYRGFQYVSKYADCGEPGGLYVYHEIIGYFDIIISETDVNEVSVKVIAHYSAPMWFGSSFKGIVTCHSRGYVERLLFEDLRLSFEDIQYAAQEPEDEEVREPEISRAPKKEISECINVLPPLRQDLFKRILKDSKEKVEQPSLKR